jgi:hypothetical protein
MKVGVELHDPAALLSGMRVWIYSIGGCVDPRGVWIFWRREKYPADGNRNFSVVQLQTFALAAAPYFTDCGQ